MTVTIGVLALQGDVREHVAALESVGARGVPVRRLGELDAVDGLILPGGESTTIDKLLRAFGLFEPLRERIARGLPVYGSCAGMILLAERVIGGREDQRTLGGIDMTVRRNAFGRQVDSFEADIHVAGFGPAPFRAVFIRAPWVEQVGPRVRVLARVAARAGESTGRIVAVQEGTLLATSFHPELGADNRMHAHFVQMASGNNTRRT
ncbi:MAG: pyridoxal 5'-phosphate synthase glutaminase subunit PdxT [Actinomycetales bacterium]|nr:pyridoxal 5'-phosphate synthase glutaminase subunit PdxT [Actinomycetales bacterium]